MNPASRDRVAMRVLQGGHDVPVDKLTTRFERTLTNLKAAIEQLPYVLIFDNDDLRWPFRPVATFELGRSIEWNPPIPKWLGPLVP